MPKSICLNNFNHSYFRMASFIRHLVSILLRMELLKEKNRHLLGTAQALLFQIHVPKHFRADAVSTTYFLINRMPSSILDWATPFQTLFPHKHLFPIEPRVFGCACYVRDVCPHVSKLDPKSLSVSSLVTLEFKRGIGVIVLVFGGTWFLLMSPFLRMPLFLPTRSTLVRGRMMIFSFILLSRQLLLLFHL